MERQREVTPPVKIEWALIGLGSYETLLMCLRKI